MGACDNLAELKEISHAQSRFSDAPVSSQDTSPESALRCQRGECS